MVQNKDGSVKETWDYVNGVEYKNRQLQRVAHSEGAVVQNEYGQYQHEYVLRDHLGNTRVTFTDGENRGEPTYDAFGRPSKAFAPDLGYDDGIVTEADIKHINHTYPFGMAMEGNWNNAGTANNNRYLYNGKQWNDDFGMGWYDYGARFYDPSIARWGAVDPMAGARLNLSPYQYVQNNPVNRTDPTGMLDEDSLWGGTLGYELQKAGKRTASERFDDEQAKRDKDKDDKDRQERNQKRKNSVEEYNSKYYKQVLKSLSIQNKLILSKWVPGSYVYNGSKFSVWCKPENGSTPIEVKPSEELYEQIDGLVTHKYCNKVFKLMGGHGGLLLRARVLPNGDVDPDGHTFQGESLRIGGDVINFFGGGWKNRNWLTNLHTPTKELPNGDTGWDALFQKSINICNDEPKP